MAWLRRSQSMTTVAATAAVHTAMTMLIPSRAPVRPGAGRLFRPAVTTIAMSTQPSGRSSCRWRSTRPRARARAAVTRADAGPSSPSCGGGGPDGSPNGNRPAAARRALMDTVWRAAGTVTRSGGVAGAGTGSGTGADTDSRGDRGGGRGQTPAADVDDDQPGQHVGQRHHDQRRDPGGLPFDLVRDTEPRDGRARAVRSGDGECHPRPDPGDPQAGGQPAGATECAA